MLRTNLRSLITGLIVVNMCIILSSCSEKKETLEVGTHPEGWNDPQSLVFHGDMVLQSAASAQNCQTCHGQNFSGGTSGVSCASCHSAFPHPEGFADGNSPDFHANLISESLFWDIESCQDCHGLDYAGGGVEAKNCLQCHVDAGGPEACNTCHGSDLNAAPPEDLAGNTETTAIGVGAHQPHLLDSTWTTAYDLSCNLCHQEPVDYKDPGHLEEVAIIADKGTNGYLQEPIAEVIFGTEATGSGNTNPVWDHEAATCGSVYCHGGFRFRRSESPYPWAYRDSVMTGNNPGMIWTDVGSGQADCGTCHGLPPAQHVGTAQARCSDCHVQVVDANLNIIDKELHINGKIEVFSTSR